MTAKKERLTVTIDKSLAEAAHAAVAAGRADSLSAFVNVALAVQLEKDRKLAAFGLLIADYEAEHGVLTKEELEAQRRADRRNAIVVRGSRKPTRKPRRTKTA